MIPQPLDWQPSALPIELRSRGGRGGGDRTHLMSRSQSERPALGPLPEDWCCVSESNTPVRVSPRLGYGQQDATLVPDAAWWCGWRESNPQNSWPSTKRLYLFAHIRMSGREDGT